jgi:hypothetical protein
MALLHEMQTSLLSGDADIAPILLKFRLLAAKLGSGPLQEWVKHELEGYPTDAEVPDYRVLEVVYRGTFSGPFGSGIKNAQIPSYLIAQYADESWNTFKMRQSVAAVDELVNASKDSGGSLSINASNLILLLQGKVYQGYACNEVSGTIGVTQLKELQHAVRSRILELLIELEKSVPGSSQISVGNQQPDSDQSGKVNQIFYQTIHGSMTNVSNTGSIDTIKIGITAGDMASVVHALVGAGIDENDAKEFANTLATETPESESEPFGAKAKTWIAKNVKKAADGTWKAGVGVATEVLKQAALKYYGLG